MNEFGVQVRHWGSGRVSMVGAVAVTAGGSVITVVAGPGGFVLRVDGVEQVLAHYGNAVVLDHLLQRGDGIAARVMASASQLTLTVEHVRGHRFRASCIPYMHTAVCSLDFIATPDFLHACGGLVGAYNGNSTDDFTGPDATQYADVDAFGESWRVTEWRMDADSEPQPPWTWAVNTSNFSPLDKMDASFGLPPQLTSAPPSGTRRLLAPASLQNATVMLTAARFTAVTAVAYDPVAAAPAAQVKAATVHTCHRSFDQVTTEYGCAVAFCTCRICVSPKV